jgi:hypothetical protein
MKKFKKVSDDFYVRAPGKNGGFKKFTGYKVNLSGFSGFDFVIWGEVGDWSVTEAISGCRVISRPGSKDGAKREAAVELKRDLKDKAESIMDLLGVSLEEAYPMALEDLIKEQVKTSGLSPRYEEVG